jgi:hypothetical protein
VVPARSGQERSFWEKVGIQVILAPLMKVTSGSFIFLFLARLYLSAIQKHHVVDARTDVLHGLAFSSYSTSPAHPDEPDLCPAQPQVIWSER